MKTSTIIFLLLFVSLLSIPATFAQTAQKVTFRLKNNGILPCHFKFLERYPDNKFPNVFTAYILPGRS